ncbi:MAG: hypothetical protein HY245_14240 [Rhizobiales bacterium]|nr:hypothetical protein [Hyphomicrobiales bacterium]MBI3674552.1 hypothetical protein [Hyphomicrobiales bacterium]
MDAVKRKRLEEVLTSYGADPARWPAADRAELSGELGVAGEALAEAAATDRLLQFASRPDAASGFEARLMARLARTAQVTTLPPLRPRPAAARMKIGWAVLPLAASLALGIYLGARGVIDSLLPAAVTNSVAAVDDDDLTGVTNVTDYSEEHVS